MAELLATARDRRLRQYVADLDWLVDARDASQITADEFDANRKEIVGSATSLSRAWVPGVIVTPLLAVMSIAIFVYEVVRFDFSPTVAQLDAMGALHSGAFAASEWWRIVTGTLLHADIVHLVVNVVATFALIGTIEMRIGPRRTLMLVLLGMLGSAAGSLLFTPETAVVGSSGVLFAAAGAMITLPRGQRGYTMQITGAIVVVLGIVQAIFYSDGIAVSAHVGGLIAGLVFGFESQDRGRLFAARASAGTAVASSAESKQAPDVSPHALTAFILAVWPLGITGVAALVLGSLAKEELAQHSEMRGRKLANAAVILGWTQIAAAIFVIVWSVSVLPTFGMVTGGIVS